MPNVSSGLSNEDGPIHTGGENDPFTTQNAPTEKPAPAQPDPSLASEADIKAALRSSEGSTELRDGLSITEDPTAAPDLAQLEKLSIDGHTMSGADVHRALTAAGEGLDAEDAERERGREAISEMAWSQFEHAAGLATTENEIGQALADLREATDEDTYEAGIWHLAEQLTHIDADDADEDELEALEEAYSLLEKQSEVVLGLRQVARSNEVAQQLLPAAAEQRAAEFHSIAKDFAHDIGAKNDTEANEHLQAAVAFAKATMQIDVEAMLTSIDGFDPKAVDAVIRSAHATLHEQGRADSNQAFRQSVLDADNTQVSSGLEMLNAFGEWVNPNAVDLGPGELDQDAVVARAQRRRTSAEQIKAGVSETDSRSVESGFTKNGKPVSAADVDPFAEIYREEREAERRKMRRFLPGS